jgi:phosphonate transport system permease protein
MTGLRRALIGLIASWLLVALILGVDARELLDSQGIDNALEIAAGFLRPDTSADTLARIAKLALESIAIGFAGTGLALVMGIALALLAARIPQLPQAPGSSRTRSRIGNGIRFCVRGVLLLFRSIPEIIWAYLFVRIFGLGAGPAVFAIAITFSGILGKLYAELLEAVDPEPVLALRAAGAGRVGTLVYGALPQVRSEWMRYALFRFECGVRSGAVLGVVGAGGLGTEIDLAVRYLEYDTLASCLLAILLIVGAVEMGSGLLHRLNTARAAAIAIALVAVSFAVLDVPWSELYGAEAIDEFSEFASSFGNPNLDPAFGAGVVRDAGETVGMAWLATGVVAILALFLAPFGSRSALMGWLEGAPSGGGTRRLLRWAVLFSTRGIFQVFRTIPEIIWALLFIVWVGPGILAGIMAVAAHTFGVLGRLFSEVVAETDPTAARALEAAGARPFGIWVFGVLPIALPRLVAYGLFRFEVNIRSTTMVGFVGAGGIGDALHTAISLFHSSDLATILFVLLSTVAIIDAIGDRIRARLLSQESEEVPMG